MKRSELIGNFSKLLHIKNYAAQTEKSYLHHLNIFLDYVKNSKVTDVNSNVLLNYFNNLKQVKLFSYSSMKQALAAIRFNEKDVRDMGRTATGVRGVRLGKGDQVVGLLVIRNDQTTVLVVTEKGFGKRSDINDYRITKRGGKGVITVKTTDKVGKLIAMMEVVDRDELVIISTQGMVIRQSVKDLRVMGRNTQGVRVIRLNEHDSIADIARVVPEDDDEINGNGNGNGKNDEPLLS